uniref:Uncharacterized protein n=1 Tax=Prymnesium polylepis TaxID=72548 RepID=A0A6T7X9E4_9EUKA|mmetsp:Transcript_1502/g.3825  ORF Transcript_1502/g.3825 Transcript_1502/m.3825 type:complete len:174 (+) Transcript_1502:23-544(+)|eukprot:4014786-Prymnesium_polylepis.1
MAQARLEQLEGRLKELYAKGGETNDYVGGFGGGHLKAGSFEEVQAHEEERRRLALEVKEAREAVRLERQGIKSQAASSGDASNWTAKLLDGDTRFDVADNGADHLLVQATHGLKTASEFRATKERVESEVAQAEELAAQERAERSEAAAAERRVRKKRQRKEQASKLSFDDED